MLDVGFTSGSFKEVVLKDDEQIVGISAKRFKNFKSRYTDL
jgi:hypothetical protein